MTEATQQIELEGDNSIHSDKKQLHGEGSSGFIRIVSWAYFLISIIASGYMMSALSIIDTYPTVYNPVIVGWSAGLVISGFMFLAVGHVLAAISDNVRLIAKNAISSTPNN